MKIIPTPPPENNPKHNAIPCNIRQYIFQTICLWETIIFWIVLFQARRGGWRYTRGHLTHWGWMTHICVDDLTLNGSDNGLSPIRRQAIIWTNDDILSIRPYGTHFNEILFEIQKFSFKKMHSKIIVCEMAAILSRPQCVEMLVIHRDIKYYAWHACNLLGARLRGPICLDSDKILVP